jgi:hypothetical protein
MPELTKTEEEEIVKHSAELIKIVNREMAGCARHSKLASIILHIITQADICHLERLGVLSVTASEVEIDRNIAAQKKDELDYIG